MKVKQEVVYRLESHTLSTIMNQTNCQKFLFVHGASFEKLSCQENIRNCGVQLEEFVGFSPNPKYEEVLQGVELYKNSGCDGILAVGGGSAMDVAKCIKAYQNLNHEIPYYKQEMISNNIPFIVLPTTAGTGSEATHFAVIYVNGEKKSIAHEMMIPDYVIMEPSVLEGLPDYQKKATAMDALAHGIESFWSVNATEESRNYSEQAIRLWCKNIDSYLEQKWESYAPMLEASYFAGKAINIAKTTAGHAMSYKLTQMYDIAHGHAAIRCMLQAWRYMQKKLMEQNNLQGELEHTFLHIAYLLGYTNVKNAIVGLENKLFEMKLEIPAKKNEEDLDILVDSVNTERLQNNPMHFSKADLTEIYKSLFDGRGNNECK